GHRAARPGSEARVRAAPGLRARAVPGLTPRGPVPGSCSGAAVRGGLSSPVGACPQCMAWRVVGSRGLVGGSRWLVRLPCLGPITPTTPPPARPPVPPSAGPAVPLSLPDAEALGERIQAQAAVVAGATCQFLLMLADFD